MFKLKIMFAPFTKRREFLRDRDNVVFMTSLKDIVIIAKTAKTLCYFWKQKFTSTGYLMVSSMTDCFVLL